METQRFCEAGKKAGIAGLFGALAGGVLPIVPVVKWPVACAQAHLFFQEANHANLFSCCCCLACALAHCAGGCGTDWPYLPAGARLWGRSRLGLRCLEGATRWNVFLPLTIKAYGPAWVLTANVPLGTALTEADATQAEVDWAAEPASVVADPSMWVGQVASRQLLAGQTLRQSMVRAPHLFKTGAQVRVVAEGPGYAVSATGQAMAAGAVGQTVRIRMANGRIISGIVDETGAVSAAL